MAAAAAATATSATATTAKSKAPAKPGLSADALTQPMTFDPTQNCIIGPGSARWERCQLTCSGSHPIRADVEDSIGWMYRSNAPVAPLPKPITIPSASAAKPLVYIAQTVGHTEFCDAAQHFFRKDVSVQDIATSSIRLLGLHVKIGNKPPALLVVGEVEQKVAIPALYSMILHADLSRKPDGGGSGRGVWAEAKVSEPADRPRIIGLLMQHAPPLPCAQSALGPNDVPLSKFLSPNELKTGLHDFDAGVGYPLEAEFRRMLPIRDGRQMIIPRAFLDCQKLLTGHLVPILQTEQKATPGGPPAAAAAASHADSKHAPTPGAPAKAAVAATAAPTKDAKDAKLLHDLASNHAVLDGILKKGAPLGGVYTRLADMSKPVVHANPASLEGWSTTLARLTRMASEPACDAKARSMITSTGRAKIIAHVRTWGTEVPLASEWSDAHRSLCGLIGALAPPPAEELRDVYNRSNAALTSSVVQQKDYVAPTPMEGVAANPPAPVPAAAASALPVGDDTVLSPVAAAAAAPAAVAADLHPSSAGFAAAATAADAAPAAVLDTPHSLYSGVVPMALDSAPNLHPPPASPAKPPHQSPMRNVYSANGSGDAMLLSSSKKAMASPAPVRKRPRTDSDPAAAPAEAAAAAAATAPSSADIRAFAAAAMGHPPPYDAKAFEDAMRAKYDQFAADMNIEREKMKTLLALSQDTLADAKRTVVAATSGLKRMEEETTKNFTEMGVYVSKQKAEIEEMNVVIAKQKTEIAELRAIVRGQLTRMQKQAEVNAHDLAQLCAQACPSV